MMNEGQNIRILVNGCSGFIGRAMLNSLSKYPFDIYGVCRKNDFVENIDNVVLFKGDATDKDFIKYVIQESKPNIIIHSLGVSKYSQAQQFPLEAFYSNFNAGLILIEVIRELSYSCNNILFIDSVAWFNEFIQSNLLTKIYDTSKAALFLSVKAYHNSGLLNHANVSILRLHQVIGKGDYSKERLVPYIINAILNNETPNINNPEKTLNWIPIDVFCDWVIESFVLDQSVEKLNTFSIYDTEMLGFKMKVSEILDKILKIWNGKKSNFDTIDALFYDIIEWHKTLNH